MRKLKLRYQRVSDAKAFYRILKNPNFKYFSGVPKSLKDEIKFLKQNAEKRRKNIEHNFTILIDGSIVGGGGIKINQDCRDTGEIGFFVDEEHWGKGIATKTAKLLEKTAFTKFKLRRIEALIHTKNKASIKVAIKCGYKKDKLLKKRVCYHGKYHDVYLFAKIR